VCVARGQGRTHHLHGAEDVAEVVSALQILGDVGEAPQVVGVLGRARDVPDLMLRHNGLPANQSTGQDRIDRQTDRAAEQEEDC